jgi:hypothetical protein
MLNCLSQCDKHLKGHAGAAQCTFTYLHVESLGSMKMVTVVVRESTCKGFPQYKLSKVLD